MGALCCLPPFCISQETLPIVPGGFALTTTKSYGSTGHIIYDIWSEVGVWIEEVGYKLGWQYKGFGMFCVRRAIPIFGRRGRFVALRTSLCELHSQIQRRTVLLWSARWESRFSWKLQAYGPGASNWFAKFQYLRLVVIVTKWISTSLIIASGSIQSST